MTYINYWLKEMIKDTPNDLELGSKIRQKSWEEQKETRYIYESPDKGKTIYRRKMGDYDSPRELISVEKFKNSEKIKTNNMEKVSLYDYLGHAAGSDLGQQVANAARQAGVKGILIIVIVTTVCLGRYAIAEGQRAERQKKMLEDMKKWGDKKEE